MSATKTARSKRKIKRAGSKALRSNRAANTPPRKDKQRPPR